MIKNSKYIVRNYKTLNFKFSGIRLHNKLLAPVDWDLSIDLVVPNKNSGPSVDNTLVFRKIYFWLEVNLHNILMVNVTHKEDFILSNEIDNLKLHCPDTTGDDLIVQLLCAKISALAAPHLTVGEIRLSASDSFLSYTFAQDTLSVLPTLASDYCPYDHIADSIPWWNRDDGFTCDYPYNALSQLTDPLDEFDQAIGKAHNGEIANIIHIDKWVPKTVE